VAEPLDLTGLIGAPRNRVASVGVELEGGWFSKFPPKHPITRDASVFKHLGDIGGLVRETPLPGWKQKSVVFGEIPLPQCPVINLHSQMREAFPQFVDATCGLHVHMSFEVDKAEFRYALLADESYLETILKYMTIWAKEQGLPEDHHFWSRLAGDNEYCQKKFWPMTQMQVREKNYDHDRSGHRYTMIHYCWGRKRTVECRLLPMFPTFEQSYSAVKHIIDITNAFLVKVEKKRVIETLMVNCPIDDDGEDTIIVKA
jgi:hypothetical protein